MNSIVTRDTGRATVVAALDPAVASVLAEGRTHGRGLDLSLELGDQLGVPLSLAMHRVLEPLHELLEVGEARLQGVDSGRALIRCSRRSRRCGALCGGGYAANLADPRDQPFALSQVHRFSFGFERAGRGG